MLKNGKVEELLTGNLLPGGKLLDGKSHFDGINSESLNIS